MFFPKKIISIRPSDRVLEIGPGSTPHPRSNEFLELRFDNEEDRLLQRGNVVKEPHFGERLVHYYDGGKFPFGDREFDYVICTHVIEHVPNPSSFLNEIFRVGGGRGYIEYPLITYEYLYNFDVHLHFLKFDSETMTLRYLPKDDTSFAEFSPVSMLFNKTLVNGWDDLCSANKPLFFEGFEFSLPFQVKKTHDIEMLVPDQSLITSKKFIRKRFGQIFNMFRL